MQVMSQCLLPTGKRCSLGEKKKILGPADGVEKWTFANAKNTTAQGKNAMVYKQGLSLEDARDQHVNGRGGLGLGRGRSWPLTGSRGCHQPPKA